MLAIVECKQDQELQALVLTVLTHTQKKNNIILPLMTLESLLMLSKAEKKNVDKVVISSSVGWSSKVTNSLGCYIEKLPRLTSQKG